MREEILQQLKTEYEAIRERNERETALRRERACAACPALAGLLEGRQQLIWQGMRGILSGSVRADDIPAQMAELNEKISRTLKAGGFAEDWLEPVYTCPLCRDTGYVGEPVREMCACMKQRANRLTYREIGLSEQEEQTFENFREDLLPDKPLPGKNYSQRTLTLIAREQCREWAEKYPACDQKTLVLSGQSGLGKTYLMNAMARKLVQRGREPLVISAYRFLDIARRSYFGQDQGIDDILQADVLLLDDLGSEPMLQNVTVVQLFNLLNERQSRGLGTVISTNLNTSELQERYTERVTSRLSDRSRCIFLPLEGEDLRKFKE